MKTRRHQVLSLVLLAFASCCFASCGGAQKKGDKGQTLKEYEANTPEEEEADPCYGKGGEPIECENQADCCKGMICTKDPERSQIQRYCEPG